MLLSLSCSACSRVAVEPTKVEKTTTPQMPAADNLPEWSPDPKFSNELTSECSATRFNPKISLKSIKGYNPRKIEIVNSTDILFRGDHVRDRLFPEMEVSVSPVSRFIGRGETAEDGFRHLLQSISAHHNKASTSAIETGMINHQPYFRAYWSQEYPWTKEMTRGFTYATIFDNRFVYLAAEDLADSADKNLPPLEAAARTVRLWK